MISFRNFLNGLASKATPDDADELYLRDSTGTPSSKKLTWTNLRASFLQQAPTVSAPAYVKGSLYFDTTLNKMMLGGEERWELVSSSMQMDDINFVTVDSSYYGIAIMGLDQATSGVNNGSVMLLYGKAGATAPPIGISTDGGVTWTRSASAMAALPGYTYPPSGNFNWNGSKFLGVGGQGSCATSTDGITWTSSPFFATIVNNPTNAVNWNGSQYLVVGDYAVCVTSPDGVTWTNRNSGMSAALGASTAIYKIVWSGSQYCVGAYNGASATSPDGITWTSRTSLATQNGGYTPNAMAFGGGIYLSTRENSQTIYSSTDGITWSTGGACGLNPNKLDWDGSQFIVSGQGQTRTSPDGTTWTAQGNCGDNAAKNLFINGSTYTFIGPGYVWLSNNSGSTWTKVDVNGLVVGAREGRAAVWDGTKFLVTGGSSTTEEFLVNSADGLSWELQPSITTATGPTFSAWAIAANSSIAVTANVGAAQGGTSTDHGVTWLLNAGIQTSLSNAAVMGAGWSGMQFLLVGDAAGAPKASTSPDGTTWTSQTTNFAVAFAGAPKAVCWGGSQWVVIGTLGKCATSPDGINWTVQTGLQAAVGSTTMFAVAWSGTKFLAVGASGKCATSPDGVNWTNQPAFTIAFGAGNIAYAVCWNGQGFVVAGAAGKCVVSPSGADWEVNTSLPTIFGSSIIYALTWNGTKIIALGASGKGAVST